MDIFTIKRARSGQWKDLMLPWRRPSSSGCLFWDTENLMLYLPFLCTTLDITLPVATLKVLYTLLDKLLTMEQSWKYVFSDYLLREVCFDSDCTCSMCVSCAYNYKHMFCYKWSEKRNFKRKSSIHKKSTRSVLGWLAPQENPDFKILVILKEIKEIMQKTFPEVYTESSY